MDSMFLGVDRHPFSSSDSSPEHPGNQTSACLLVFHGSRDPRPQAAVEQVATLLQNQFPETRLLIRVAALELAPKPLHEQLYEFAKVAQAQGIDRLQIVPLFLLGGVHVMEDIPREIGLAQQMLQQEVKIEIKPFLGSHPHLASLLTPGLTPEADAHILLAHGSRRAAGNQVVEQLAQQLGACSAYWSVNPDLKTRLQELAEQGHRRISIVPYFLFPGGITDAISQMVLQLSETFPHLSLNLADPIGPSSELVTLILDLLNLDLN